MDPLDQCPYLFVDLGECPAGQDISSWRYTGEPGRIGGGSYGFDSAMALSNEGTYSGQSSTDSYDGVMPFMAPFDEFAHQVDTGLTFDACERPLNTISPRQPRCPFPRGLKTLPGVTHSVSSAGTQRPNEDEQRHVCQECNMLFRNLQELDQHAKRTPHKAWRCAEPFCDKTYARRDTFLRHRATHKDKSHPCSICSLDNRQKVFKRKDHLKEHIRNCHSKGIEAKSVESVRSNGENVCISSADPGGRWATAAAVVKIDECKQTMVKVVKSLHAVMGDDKENIIGQLGDSLTTLSEPEMEKVASNMVRAALETTMGTSDRRVNGPYVPTGR